MRYTGAAGNGANVFTTVFYTERANNGDNGFAGNGVIVIKMQPYDNNQWHYMDYFYVNDYNLKMYLSGAHVTICTGCVPSSQWVTLEVLLDAPTWNKFRVCVNGVQQGSDYAVQGTAGINGIRTVDLGVSRADSPAWYQSAVWSTRADTLGCTTCSTAPATPCNPATSSPTAAPTPLPTVAPTPSPTQSPVMPPTASPTVAPSGAPSSSPSAGPTLPPTAAPSVSPTSSPMAQPTASPLGPSPSPSASPTSVPTAAPSTPPTEPPTRSPTQAPINPTGSPSASPTTPTVSPTQSPLGPTPPPINPTDSPTSSPSASPTLSPTVPPSQSPLGPTSSPADPTNAPSSSPSTAPTAAPTSSPSLSPIGGPPHPLQPTAAPRCPPTRFRDPSGECVLCTTGSVKGGCRPEQGGYPAPAADGGSCVCKCRYYWTGEDCSICPTGMGGLDCDRCAVGDAAPPQCVAPRCADPASLPADMVTECGSGAREVALLPALYHRGLPAAVVIAAASVAEPPLLSLPEHAPVQQLGAGVLAVQGAELQLSQWLQLRILPAAPLTHATPITVQVNISGIGCTPVNAEFAVGCPAPLPHVSGALPSAAVPEGQELTVPCALAELAHVHAPFSVRSNPPGAISYNPSAELCTVHASELPSQPPASGTTAVITVTGPGGAEVLLPMHIEVNPPICGTRVRGPEYVQLPPSGKGYESVGYVSVAELGGDFVTFDVLGDSGGVSIRHQQDGALRVTVNHEAAEGTLYARLLYTVNGTRCSEAQPVRTFWGPGVMGATDHIRQPVLQPFAHVLRARAVSSVGSLPWCLEPQLRLAQQPGGLRLSTSKNQWVLSGVISTPGAHLAYITATDCRGGSARIRVELYGVVGTELGPLPDSVYLEDTPLQISLPRVLSTERDLTLSLAPRLDAQLQMGTLRAQCPGGVNVTQDQDAGLALALGGPVELLGQCRITLIPAPDGCDALRLVWRAVGQAQEQLLSAICGPDPPVATPRHRFVRWGEYVEAPISTLVHSVDHDQCLVVNTDANESHPWLVRSDNVIGGYAPGEDAEQCQVVNAYTCRTNLSAQTRFCATSLPDARTHVAQGPIECVEDTACPLHDNVSIEMTRITHNHTVIYLVVWSSPPVLRELRFDGNTADAPAVRRSAEGELRVEGTFEQVQVNIARMLFLVVPDFDGTVNISVRGAVGTAIAESGPLTVRYRPVNDAPRCNKTCEEVRVSCGLLGGDEEALDYHYKDVDDEKLRYGANETSLGVRVVGSLLKCSSFIALLTFYGLPYAGSAKVFAVDASGAVSPTLEVEVVYELTDSETYVAIIFTVVASLYGSFLLLFRPGVVAAARNLRRRIGGDKSTGEMLSRVGRRAAAHLRGAEMENVSVFQAGCGLWWLRDDGDISSIAASAEGGAAAVVECGDFLLGAQPESAFDPGEPLLCAALSPRWLGLGGSPRLSVLHADPKAKLKLCFRLRHKGAAKAGLVWALGLTRVVVAAARSSGPDLVEYTGTAQQLTEFAHMQRVVGPAGCKSELVWTLSEGRSDRALLGGAVPVATTAGEATLCGGEEAASPKAAGAAAGAAPAAPARLLSDGLSQPLLSPGQQQQQPRRPNLNAFRPSRVSRVELDELRQNMEQMMQQRTERERELEIKVHAAEQKAEQRVEEAERKFAHEVQRARTAAAYAHLSALQTRGGPLNSPQTPPVPPCPPPRRSPTRRLPLSPPARRSILGIDPPPPQKTE